jgi:hypothetical protein
MGRGEVGGSARAPRNLEYVPQSEPGPRTNQLRFSDARRTGSCRRQSNGQDIVVDGLSKRARRQKKSQIDEPDQTVDAMRRSWRQMDIHAAVPSAGSLLPPSTDGSRCSIVPPGAGRQIADLTLRRARYQHPSIPPDHLITAHPIFPPLHPAPPLSRVTVESSVGVFPWCFLSCCRFRPRMLAGLALSARPSAARLRSTRP